MADADGTTRTDAPDALMIGRLGVDLYPLQSGVGLDRVDTFGKFLGGSAANVAVATARHGHRPALLSRVGDDPFGRYLLAELERLGVDNRYVEVDGTWPTPITFCEIFPPDDFPLYFYREPMAPDLNLPPEQLDLDAVRDARILWFTGTGLCREPSRSTHHVALEARRGREGTDRDATGSEHTDRRHTVFDLDYRPMFWPEPAEATREYARALEHATVAVGNREECAVAVGETDPERAADALLERGVELAIVKQGPLGVLGKTRDESVVVPPFPIDVVNGLGAGDGFGGALCHGLLEGWGLERTLRFANAAGAIVAGRLECSTAMPTTPEVDALMGSAP